MNSRIKKKQYHGFLAVKGDLLPRGKLVERRSLHDVLNENVKFQSSKHPQKIDRIFSLAWNIFYCLLKGPCFELFRHGKYGDFWVKKLMEIYLLVTEKFLSWNFREWEIQSFFETKSWDGKIVFTDYWKVLVLNFSGIGNTVFFWGKKLMERWCLLVTEKFLFWTFRWWEIQSSLRQKVNGKTIFTDCWKVLVFSPWAGA